MKFMKDIFKLILLIWLLIPSNAFSAAVNKIDIIGNDRISDETIKMFISDDIKDEINDAKLNKILKDLYETEFFKDINIKFYNQILSIEVQENPIIEKIIYNGIKSNRILEIIKQDTSIKQRSSFNENSLKKEKLKIENILKSLGYYNSSLDILVNELNNNLINIT